MTGAETSGELTTHLTTGAMVVYAIEYLKRLPGFRRLTPDTKTANAVVSACFALAIGVGITWSGNWQDGWTFHVPALAVLLSGLWDAVKQFVIQQLVYDGVVQKDTGGTV